jgi:methyl-accepting chemotaxis protein
MRISITGKICFILLVIFSLVLISTTLYQAFRERELVLKLGTEHVSALLQNYRNGLDLISNSHQPEQLTHYQKTFSEQTNVLRLKWISTQNNDAFGSTTADNLPSDQQEKQALQGQTTQRTTTHNGKTQIVTIVPYYLPTQSSSEAKPVAAIRMEYSLDKQLDLVEQHILMSAIMLSTIFSGVLMMTLSITRKHIVLRLQNLRQAIDNAADFDDLSIRLPIVHNDEIDQVNESFNQLMTHLSTKSPNNK